jgi:hypothetical protein
LNSTEQWTFYPESSDGPSATSSPSATRNIMTLPFNWLTVLKWAGAAAAVVAVIGVPVWYMNSRIDAAYEQGVQVGKADCMARHAELAAQAAEEAAKTINEEGQKAKALEEKNAKLQTKFTGLEKRLNEALSKSPPPVGCIVSIDATRVLADAAEGDFSSEGASVPGQLDPTVPGESTFPGERKFNNS